MVREGQILLLAIVYVVAAACTIIAKKTTLKELKGYGWYAGVIILIVTAIAFLG